MVSKSNTTGVPATELRRKDHIYALLKADIISCNLKPGSAVSEAKLASRYDMGKAPIRDALARLCHEKLVISQPRKGHIIAPITIRDVIDLYGVRMALEPVAARMAAGQVDAASLRKAAKACELSFSLDDPESVAKFLRCNSELHNTIARFSGNRRLASQIAGLLEDTERVRHIMVGSVKSSNETISEHTALIEALISGNKDDAESLTKSHIQRGWRMVLSSLLSQFQFMDLNIGGPLDEANTESLHQPGAEGAQTGTGSDQVIKLVNSIGDEPLGDFPATARSSRSPI